MNRFINKKYVTFFKPVFIGLSIISPLIALFNPLLNSCEPLKIAIHVMSLVLLAIILTYTIYLSYFRRNDLVIDKNDEINDKLFQIAEIISRLENKHLDKRYGENHSYYKLLMINARLKTELTKYQKIQVGEWVIKAKDKYSYLREVFSSVILELSEGDEYMAISDLDFWSETKFGKPTEESELEDFLEANFMAVSSGVKVKRIIVLEKVLLEKPRENMDKINNLKAFIKNYNEYQSFHQFSNDQMELRFHVMDELSSKFPNIPFAIISNKNLKQSIVVTTGGLKDQPKEGEAFLKIKFINSRKDLDNDRNHVAFNKFDKKGFKTIDTLTNELNNLKM